MIQNLADQHSLFQIVHVPTRGSVLLDLVYVSMQIIICVVSDLPPIAGSDHSAQLVRLPATEEAGMKLRNVVDYKQLELLLSHIDSRVLFVGCVTVDYYALRLNTALVDAINASTLYKPRYKRERFPRHIVQLICIKQKKWKAAKQSSDYSAYIALRKTVRAAIRSHHRNLESRFIYNNNCRAFFSHVSKRLNNNDRQIHLEVNGAITSDGIAAETFLNEFSSNFFVATDVSSCVN